MRNKIEDFPVFTDLDDQTIQNMLAKMNGYLSNVSDILKIDTHKLDVSMEIMCEIVERIEKRRIYFHVFYDHCKMGELNEGALMCFWILKLTPFHHNGIPSNILNAKIALCLLMNVLHYHALKKGMALSLSQNVMDNIYYAFRFRDLSKEAIMILAERLLRNV